MNSKLAVFLVSLLGVADGFGLFPRPSIKKIMCRNRKNANNLAAGAAIGAAAIGTASIGTAFALNRLNNLEKNVYYPPIGSMKSQVVIITGASSGLGLESAKRLAEAGATVVLTSRSEEKGTRAIESVKEYLRNKNAYDEKESKLFNIKLDLDSLESVKQFPDLFEALGVGQISVLVNNAGVMAIPDRQKTMDGFERTYQSNHLGHFVLTAALFPYFSRQGCKVINVASTAHNFASQGLDINNLNSEKSYSAWPAYGASKLANILFTQELQRKSDEAGLDWFTTVCLHPGVVGTDLWRYIAGEDMIKKMKDSVGFSLESVAATASLLFFKTPAEGANTQIYLAAIPAKNLSKGSYYDEMKVATLKPFATDEESAKSLWVASEEMGSISFDFEKVITIKEAGVDLDESRYGKTEAELQTKAPDESEFVEEDPQT